MRITWKREEKSSGIAGVRQGPRGYNLNVNGERVASVNWVRMCNAWMWSVAKNDDLGIPWSNSSARGVYYQDIERAKMECKAYVVQCLKAKEV